MKSGKLEAYIGDSSDNGEGEGNGQEELSKIFACLLCDDEKSGHTADTENDNMYEEMRRAWIGYNRWWAKALKRRRQQETNDGTQKIGDIDQHQAEADAGATGGASGSCRQVPQKIDDEDIEANTTHLQYRQSLVGRADLAASEAAQKIGDIEAHTNHKQYQHTGGARGSGGQQRHAENRRHRGEDQAQAVCADTGGAKVGAS